MKALIGLKGTKLTALKWHQVHAWRLSQHGLSLRLNSQDVIQAVTRTGGIQAQVMSAAELALCARVEGLSAVILVNGSIQGVWQSTTRRSQTVVKVHLFCSPTALIQKGIEAEVERLSDFFKTKVLLEYEHLSSSGL